MNLCLKPYEHFFAAYPPRIQPYIVKVKSGCDLRALRLLKRKTKSAFIFVNERGAPFRVSGLQKLLSAPNYARPSISRTFKVGAGISTKTSDGST
jgi:hypothetical protein